MDPYQKEVSLSPDHSARFVDWWNNFKSTGMVQEERKKQMEDAEK